APAAALLAVSAGSLAVLRIRRAGDSAKTARVVAFAALWLSAGVFAGRLRIATPADQARAAFRRVAHGAGESSDAVEGVLTDFWNGSPPRARTTQRAAPVPIRSGWGDVTAQVVVYLAA